MEDNSSQATMIAVIVDKSQVTEKEQTAGSGHSAEAIEMITDKLEEQRGQKKKKEMYMSDSTEDLKNIGHLTFKAKNAKVKYEPFNPDDGYNTLIDLFYIHAKIM